MTTYRGQHYMDFDAPAQAHSPTSVAAAKTQTPGRKQIDQDRIVEVLRRLGPCTDERIGEETGLDGNTVRPRRGELVAAGTVVAVDHEGRTKSGNRATRWGLTAGKAVP